MKISSATPRLLPIYLLMIGMSVIPLICPRCFAQERAEVGTLSNASFRIDVPRQWNGILVLYCHGYSTGPVTYRSSEPLNSRLATLVKDGYAIAESGYSQGGWALSEDLASNRQLFHYFITHYRKPRLTIIFGESFGGFLTIMSMEKAGTPFNAGLALCAPAGAANWFMGRRVFDFRVVFDYYFPGLFPSPIDMSDKVLARLPSKEKVIRALKRKPAAAAEIRMFSNVHSDSGIAADARFFTYILYDLEKRCGGNPFSNVDVLYQGTTDDIALNKGVMRTDSNPSAARCLARNYTPTGQLHGPLLTVSTTYDPLIPAWVSNSYVSTVADAGKSSLLVNEFVAGSGHCAISDRVVANAIRSLTEWKTAGLKPAPGLLP